MIQSHTARGFRCVRVRGDDGRERLVLQESSAIGDHEEAVDRPGSSYLWVGETPERPHLSREQVKDLVAYLNRWLDTGGLFEE